MKYLIALVSVVMAAALALPLALAAVFFSPVLVMAAPLALAGGEPRLTPAGLGRARPVVPTRL
jgi:hypothetical protein